MLQLPAWGAIESKKLVGQSARMNPALSLSCCCPLAG